MKNKFDLIDYFMVFAIIFFMLVGTLSVNAQSMVGVMGGYNFTMEKEVGGVMISKKIPTLKEMQVGMGYMTPLDNFGKGTVMANYQIQIFDFTLGGGVGVPLVDNQKVFPFLLLTYKPFKRSAMKIFLNSTEKRQVVGLSYPIWKTRKR